MSDILATVHEEQSQSQGTAAATSPHQLLKFYSVPLSSHLLKATVEVDSEIWRTLQPATIELFRDGNFEGFDRSTIPAEYIGETYRGEINGKIKNYIFHHLVTDFLMNELFARKISTANYPRLMSIEALQVTPSDSSVKVEKKLNYHFDVSIADPIELKEWKHFAFKAPKRKKYKDLDKQVVSFIENRSPNAKKANLNCVEDQDWVLFDAAIVDNQDRQLSNDLSGSFLIRVATQEVMEPLVMEFLGKTLETSFYTNNLDLHQQEHTFEDRNHRFLVTIKAIIKGAYFSLDIFRSMFKLKNKADIHNKLMEVFSYRNDVSQRKAIIEEVFHLLLSKHRFEVPKHLVLRREEYILQILANQPDYHVYKAQKDFLSYIEMLAEKQLKEEIIIDHIAYNENIKTDIRDIQHYLHLLSNKRLKEFIYFKPLIEKIEETDTPINTTTISQAVMRERTLNYIIHTLTK